MFKQKGNVSNTYVAIAAECERRTWLTRDITLRLNWSHGHDVMTIDGNRHHFGHFPLSITRALSFAIFPNLPSARYLSIDIYGKSPPTMVVQANQNEANQAFGPARRCESPAGKNPTEPTATDEELPVQRPATPALRSRYRSPGGTENIPSVPIRASRPSWPFLPSSYGRQCHEEL